MKKRIIYIPLEDIEQRYTKMMNQSLAEEVDIYLYPEFNYSEVIESGQFLDVNKTIIFKSLQLQMIAEMFYKKEVLENDVFLVGDIFFPGIESIRYMAELQGINIQIFGFNYAGRADKTDFVQKLGSWADYSEQAYHDICDGVFVGSQVHKENVIKHFININPDKIHVTGYIWDRDFVDDVYGIHNVKQDYVIFPHRITSEKGMDEFLQFAKSTDKTIVITSSGNHQEIELPDNVIYKSGLTKKEYYEIMSKAKWYLSTAYQETFGYTLQEAIHFGCLISVPNRACYPEMVPKIALYDKVEDIAFVEVNKFWTEKWNKNKNLVIKIINS